MGVKKKDLKGIFEKFELDVLTKINGKIQKAREEAFNEGFNSVINDLYNDHYPVGQIFMEKHRQDAKNALMSKKLRDEYWELYGNYCHLPPLGTNRIKFDEERPENDPLRVNDYFEVRHNGYVVTSKNKDGEMTVYATKDTFLGCKEKKPLKFEDLKVGMEVKFNHLAGTYKVNEIRYKDGLSPKVICIEYVCLNSTLTYNKNQLDSGEVAIYEA